MAPDLGYALFRFLSFFQHHKLKRRLQSARILPTQLFICAIRIAL